MNNSMKSSARVMAVVAIAVATVIFLSLSGCRGDHDDHAGHDHTSVHEPSGEAVTVAQTTCPVMEGSPINKALFVEYEGKRVYFCCAGCPEMFQANPEKYIATLPQFGN